jgi:hypothetical protein
MDRRKWWTRYAAGVIQWNMLCLLGHAINWLIGSHADVMAMATMAMLLYVWPEIRERKDGER